MGIVSRLPDLIKEYQKMAESLENLKQEDMVNYVNHLVENSQGIKTFMRKIWYIMVLQKMYQNLKKLYWLP